MKINWLGIFSRLKASVLGRGRTVATDSLSIFSFDLIGLAIGLANSILVARFFGPQGRGIISMVVLVPTMLYCFSDVGLSQSATFLVSRNKDQAKSFLFSILLLSAVFSGILVLGAFLSFDYWHKWYQNYPAELFLLALPSACFMLTLVVSRYYFLGLQEIFFFNMINISQALGSLIVILVTGLALNNNLHWYIVMFLGNLLLNQALVLIFVSRSLPGSAKKTALILKPILNYGVRMYPANIMFILRVRIDQFILGYYLEPGLLGIYTIAVFMSENLMSFPASVQQSLFPKISSSAGEDKYHIMARTLKMTFLLAVLLSLGMAAAGYPLIWILFGKKFLPAYPALVVLLLVSVFDSVWKIVGIFFVATERPGLVSFFSFISVLANAFFSFLLIPVLGMLGAATARLCSSFIISGLGLRLFQRESKFSLAQIIIPNREDYQLIKSKIISWITSRA